MLGQHLIDIFAKQFLFYILKNQSNNNLNVHLQFLDNIALTSLLDSLIALVVADASIKNHIAMSIAHVHIQNKQVIKTIHHAVNVITTEAKLFAIRCGINQATNLQGISKIIIVTDSIHSAEKIFDYSLYSCQIHTVAISQELRRFFNSNSDSTIKFWECPSHSNWILHKAVNKETKKLHSSPTLPWKLLWDFSKKRECNNLINYWKMIFQASDDKGHNFLELLDGEDKPLELTYSKGGTWLKYFGHSNSLCARASRAIINHVPIREYQLRFFPHEESKCSCSDYPIESRHHILHECKRFNNYWNPQWDTIGHSTFFLMYNSSAFSFRDSTT